MVLRAAVPDKDDLGDPSAASFSITPMANVKFPRGSIGVGGRAAEGERRYFDMGGLRRRCAQNYQAERWRQNDGVTRGFGYYPLDRINLSDVKREKRLIRHPSTATIPDNKLTSGVGKNLAQIFAIKLFTASRPP